MEFGVCAASHVGALLDRVPGDRLHQRIHAGHNCWVIPEEERFVTKPLLEASCLIGTRDQLIDRIGALSEAGLHQLMTLPGWEPRRKVLERVAEVLFPAFARS